MGSPDTCGVPRDVSLELRLDRFLLPSSAIRQALKLYNGNEDVSPFLQPEYDVVERVLVYKLGEGDLLAPGARYTVELLVPNEKSDSGLRAFDGAPIGDGPVPLTFDFHVQKSDPRGTFAPSAAPTCQEVLAEFEGAGCAGHACHSRPSPRMGLELDSREGLLTTAIQHVAHQANTGPKAGVPLEDPTRFGTNMPVIDPNRPDNSYLLYKVVRKPENFASVSCGAAHPGLPPVADCAPSSEESARLREWFVRGEPMPLRAHAPLDLRLVQRWILHGAACP